MLLKECLIFAVLFLVLALGMHMNQWFTHPLEHLMQLSNHKMPYHPLLYSTIVYLLVGSFRLLAHLMMKLFKRR